MNIYDEKYDIRIADYNDIGMIMDFIENNWRHNHILARDKKLFEYEFLEPNGEVNFFLAINKDTGSLEAITGFLKASHDTEHLDTWGVMWKTKPGNMALLGTEIKKRRIMYLNCRTDMGVGDNPNTAIPIFSSLMHRYTAKMNHYYMISDKDDYKIAIVNEKNISAIHKGKGSVLVFNSIEELNEKYNLKQNIGKVPYKDSWYLDHRYFQHISYKYEVCGVLINDRVEAIIVFRKEYLEGHFIYRIVDYIGEQSAITEIGDYFSGILDSPNCEYIDFYNLGIKDTYLRQVGFVLRDENDKNIIPNYFHPFVQENIDIWVDSTDSNAVFMKGDSDQDRPN